MHTKKKLMQINHEISTGLSSLIVYIIKKNIYTVQLYYSYQCLLSRISKLKKPVLNITVLIIIINLHLFPLSVLILSSLD